MRCVTVGGRASLAELSFGLVFTLIRNEQLLLPDSSSSSVISTAARVPSVASTAAAAAAAANAGQVRQQPRCDAAQFFGLDVVALDLRIGS